MSSLLLKQVTVSSWGNTTRSNCLAYRPERQHELLSIVSQAQDLGVIAYGNGLNYSDQAFNTNGNIITTTRLNRLISFDQHSGELVCEPGVTFIDLLQTFLPKGWGPPVIPGSLDVTVGGAVANDVHGKENEQCTPADTMQDVS